LVRTADGKTADLSKQSICPDLKEGCCTVKSMNDVSASWTKATTLKSSNLWAIANWPKALATVLMHMKDGFKCGAQDSKKDDTKKADSKDAKKADTKDAKKDTKKADTKDAKKADPKAADAKKADPKAADAKKADATKKRILQAAVSAKKPAAKASVKVTAKKPAAGAHVKIAVKKPAVKAKIAVKKPAAGAHVKIAVKKPKAKAHLKMKVKSPAAGVHLKFKVHAGAKGDTKAAATIPLTIDANGWNFTDKALPTVASTKGNWNVFLAAPSPNFATSFKVEDSCYANNTFQINQWIQQNSAELKTYAAQFWHPVLDVAAFLTGKANNASLIWSEETSVERLKVPLKLKPQVPSN
jgi:hypothetical protein